MGVLPPVFTRQGVDLICAPAPPNAAGLYVQMVGRARASHQTKRTALLLDFAVMLPPHGD